MKRQIQARRRGSGVGKTKQAGQRRSRFAPRPFPTEMNSAAPDINQAQQDRIARSSPGVMDIPLYPPTGSQAAAGTGSVQMRQNEANLKPPRGTLQRQQMDAEKRQDELNLMPQESALPDEEKEEAVQAKQEDEAIAAIEDVGDEEQEQLQAKAEAEAVEAEADKEIQKKEEKKDELKTKLEPEEKKETELKK